MAYVNIAIDPRAREALNEVTREINRHRVQPANRSTVIMELVSHWHKTKQWEPEGGQGDVREADGHSGDDQQREIRESQQEGEQGQ